MTGGAEKLMVDLLPRLQDRGHEVELVVFNGTRTPFFEQLESTGIRIHSLREGGSVYDPRNILALRKYMVGKDIVHTHNTAPQLFAAIAASTIVGKKPLLITTEHNTTNRRRNKPLLKPIDQWMYSQYTKVICISDQAETNLRAYLSDQTDKICTIFNGVDVSKYRQQKSTRDVNDPTVIVTMVAAFREQKDQNTLIRAMSYLPENVILQLVGTGEEALISACKKLTADLGLDACVRFLGMRTDVPAILADSDIVVLSSHYEGLSLSSIEGMASGKPFVASDVDGLHEIVNGYGLLFNHEDARQLADILLKIIKDKDLAQKIALKCQARAMQYDINQMRDKYCDVYTSLKTL